MWFLGSLKLASGPRAGHAGLRSVAEVPVVAVVVFQTRDARIGVLVAELVRTGIGTGLTAVDRVTRLGPVAEGTVIAVNRYVSARFCVRVANESGAWIVIVREAIAVGEV